MIRKLIDGLRERRKHSLHIVQAVIDFAKSTDRLRSQKDEDESGTVDEERIEMEN